MTNTKANEILRTKYPTATIYKKNTFHGVFSSAFSVTFTDGGKVYNYNASNYGEVLQKLGFTVLYIDEIEDRKQRIERIQNNINAGQRKKLFGGVHVYTSEEIQEMKKEIEDLKQLIDSAIIV